MLEQNKLVRSISVYRFLAILIVLSYHLISIPSYSLTVINVFNEPLKAPIISSNFLSSLDSYIFGHLHADFGSLGVMMFFVASGYLCSRMMERYSRREFIINRVFSTFPTLWVSLIVCVAFVYFSQGVVISVSDFLVSAFPLWPRLSGAFVSVVLWTLRIEMKFYILAALFGKNRKSMVLYGYLLIFFSSLVYYEFNAAWLYPQVYDLSYMGFLFVGVLIECAQREQDKNGLKKVLGCVVLNIFIFKFSAWVFQDDRTTYVSCFTQAAPVALLLALLALEKYVPKVYDFVPRFVYVTGKLTYPLYLIQCSCGLSVMYQVSRLGARTLTIILAGFISVFAVAGLIYVLVTKPSTALMRKTILAMRPKPAEKKEA